MRHGLRTIHFKNDNYEITVTTKDGKKWDVVDGRIIKEPSSRRMPSQTKFNNNGNAWMEAGSYVDALLRPGKIKSFAKALASKLLEGPASEIVINYRYSCCFGLTIKGERVSEPCRSLYTDGGNSYCRTCGCGNHKRARLNPAKPGDFTTSKLAYPYLQCPAGKFSPVKGRKK